MAQEIIAIGNQYMTFNNRLIALKHLEILSQGYNYSLDAEVRLELLQNTKEGRDELIRVYNWLHLLNNSLQDGGRDVMLTVNCIYANLPDKLEHKDQTILGFDVKWDKEEDAFVYGDDILYYDPALGNELDSLINQLMMNAGMELGYPSESAIDAVYLHPLYAEQLDKISNTEGYIEDSKE